MSTFTWNGKDLWMAVKGFWLLWGKTCVFLLGAGTGDGCHQSSYAWWLCPEVWPHSNP